MLKCVCLVSCFNKIYTPLLQNQKWVIPLVYCIPFILLVYCLLLFFVNVWLLRSGHTTGLNEKP